MKTCQSYIRKKKKAVRTPQDHQSTQCSNMHLHRTCLTSFDCMNNALSPHMSSYLQYLKDPTSMPAFDTLQWPPTIPQSQEWLDMGIMDNSIHGLPLYSDNDVILQDNLEMPSDVWLHAPFDNYFIPPQPSQQDHKVSISYPLIHACMIIPPKTPVMG